MGYDPASQVTHILHQLTATATQINQADYVYNGVGNRTSLTDRRGPQTFGYDSLDRLTSASHPLLATPQAFAYDPVGNRTTGGSVTNVGNQLTADANFAYQYDDNGNLTRKTLLATGNFMQYTYDTENRLTKVENFAAGNPTAVATSTYRYDGLGRRIEKVGNGITRRYVYDGEDILLEYDGSNVLQARYTHGPGIDEPIAVTKGEATFFYHQDALGSVTDLTDAAGATAKSYSYDAYGTILESPGTLDQPYTYTGREFDSESGLYYYRARYYDPTTGRFLQKDPILSVNLYPYVVGNPVNLLDPLGFTHQGSGNSNCPQTKKCKGKARILGGNPNTVGRQGGFPGVRVQPGSAAVIPQQFGTPKSGLAPDIGGISGTTAGGQSFNGVTDVIGGKSPIPGMNVRDALELLNPNLFIIELPTGSDEGIADVELTIPIGRPCPTGTIEQQAP